MSAPRTRRGRIVRMAVDPAAPEPLRTQIYGALRRDIASGLLPAGARLPSTRALAGDLGVARSTVVQAYEQLRLEGYLEGRPGAGTRVAERLPDDYVRPVRAPRARGARNGSAAEAPVPGPSARGRAIVAAVPSFAPLRDRAPRAFRAGVPAVDVFPLELWGRLLSRRWQRMSPKQLAYIDPFGHPPLREAVADYLRAARGVHCEAAQVMIVAGSQQALDLCGRVLLDPGDQAWLEDPGYHGARGALTAAGAELVPVPVDDEGLDVAYGCNAAPGARLAFVTPARQLPLGVTLSPARRRALLAWARARGAWVIEDDYDSEFRYASRPLGALQGEDDAGCVLHVGTFSKVMAPSLRLGYLVVPPALVDAFAAARHFTDYSSSWLEQAVLADFITAGHFERHIRRMRSIYQERMECLVAAARRDLAGVLDVAPADAGMTLVGWLHGHDDVAAARAAREAGIETLPLRPMSIRHTVPPGLILGYAGVPEPELIEGVKGLARVLGRGAGKVSGER